MLSYFEIIKKEISQNMLGIVNIDVTLVYAVVRWEGSGHGGVALFQRDCQFGKYWLDDAGYALSSYVLTPYRGERYHFNAGKAAQANQQLRKSSSMLSRELLDLKKSDFHCSNACIPILLPHGKMLNFIRAHAVHEDPFDAEYIQDLKDQEDDNQEVDIAGNAANARQLYAWRD